MPPACTLGKDKAMALAKSCALRDEVAWGVYWKDIDSGDDGIVTSWYVRPIHEYGTSGSPNGSTRLCFYDAAGHIWWGEQQSYSYRRID